jgi:hypothetical protein
MARRWETIFVRADWRSDFLGFPMVAVLALVQTTPYDDLLVERGPHPRARTSEEDRQ